ncbi:hypothetical protein M408DRAFT_261209 [Serendipita vermifera MAFF 305830]|uniref:Myb-like domain-containing protein n=1 Tax=Serendipita vermifera MAFF 305830 TaxID=933852 RepID=A0A0C3BJ47_SERVB|nr:hypothetical protein M408DRAFT_261209 [Serendipita vermifera MAFF 305830]
MSRIDKGGTKFRPAMPRGQKDRVSEKPRSSRAKQPEGTVSVGPSLRSADAPSVATVGANTSTSAIDSSRPIGNLVDANSNTIQEETTDITTNDHSNSESTHSVRPVGTTLLMPSRSGARGNAISMPLGQRMAPPTSLGRVAEPESTRGTSSAPTSSIATSVTPSLGNGDPVPRVEGSSQPKRKNQKRKAAEEAQSQEAERDSEVTEPVTKRRRQSKAASTSQAAEPSPRRTRRASRASAVHTEDGEENEEPDEERRTRRRVRSTTRVEVESDEDEDRPTRRGRRSRPHIDKPVNAVPEEIVPVDETTMTMKDLCNGLGQGRVSGRFLEVFVESNEATKQKRGENLRLKDLTRRKELGLPMDDEEANTLSARSRRAPTLALMPSQGPSELPNAPASIDIHERDGDDDEEDDEYAGLTVTTRAPKVRYDANGNLVLDETELQFDRQAEADEEQAARGPMEVIVETDRGKFTNHASYSRKPRVDRWTKDETEQFYLGLRMFHTGFELIARTLPNRNRTMVRNKFKAEDRKNPEKVTHYLSASMRLPYDLDFLSRETGRDFSGPIPQVQAPVAMIENGEGTEKDDEIIKQRLSTAPPSGGESDREGTSVSVGTNDRGRPTTKTKGKRKSSKSSNTPRPPSMPPRSMSVVTAAGSLPEGSNTAEREKDPGPRPPRIAIANVSQPPLNPASGVQINRTTLNVSGGRNMLVLPGGGREFRRNE